MAKSNGTLVPNSLVLAPTQLGEFSHSSLAESRSNPIFRPSPRGLDGLDAFFPKMGLLAGTP